MVSLFQEKKRGIPKLLAADQVIEAHYEAHDRLVVKLHHETDIYQVILDKDDLLELLRVCLTKEP